MESEEGHIKGASRAAWFLLKANVALAVATIKSRPPGTSVRDHAEALASRLRSRDESWKKEAQRLQGEVLRLRQEMLIARATTDARSSAETTGPDSAVGDISQDLFGPSDLQLGSDSETPELLPRDPQPVVSVSPPPPPPPVSSDHHAGPLEKAMHPHVQFLQSLCALHRVEGNHRGLEALWFGPDGDAGSVLADSVCQLLESVAAACRDPPPPPGPRRDVVLQACRVAARAMDLFCSQRLPCAEFTRRVEAPLSELTAMLLHGHQPSGLEAAEQLMKYLITLGSSSMSKPFLIRHILCQISALADQLWQAFQGQEASGLEEFPVDQYQNSFHLFWILEELLQKSEVPCRVEVGSEQTGFLRHLEQRVFLMSDEFPLFCIYLWRIGGLLASSDKCG